MNYTYLLRCADGSLYCGWTNRLTERVKAHNEGKGAKYTKSRRPVTLAYYECFATKEEAMKREAAIKGLQKSEKERIVKASQGSSGTKTGETNMKIIISPAKRMRMAADVMPWHKLPVFTEEASLLLKELKKCTEPELKQLYQANDAITHENYQRLKDMKLTQGLTPAVLSYVGIQYQYMAPQIFSQAGWDYICRHLRIISGFYGCLQADDGITPYRLEMQAKLSTKGAADLYGFWKDKIYRELKSEEGVKILNLASKEYAKVIEPYLCPTDEYVTCIFGVEEEGNVKVKATQAKMARGEMVRFLAEKQAEDFETVKEFDRLNYTFCPEKSSGKEYVFIMRKKDDSIIS